MLAISGGCASTRVSYPWQGVEAGAARMRERDEKVRSIQAEARIVLTNAAGQSVVVEGLLLLDPGAGARLRAWKFDQPVLDVTRTPEGTWVWMGRQGDERAREWIARAMAPDGVVAWSFLPGLLVATANGPADQDADATFELVGAADDRGNRVQARFDRATLTLRELGWTDANGRELSRVRCERYRWIAGQPCPGRVSASSPHGSMVMDVGRVEVNVPLAPRAFVPPTDALPWPAGPRTGPASAPAGAGSP